MQIALEDAGQTGAHALAREGATVVVAGRDAGKAQAVVDTLQGAGGASSVSFDAQDVPSIHAAANAAAARHGTIDFPVNCVGTNQIEPLLEVTEEAYDRVLDVNLRASMFLAQAVARVQVAAGRGGRHVHLLSVRAQLGMRDRSYSAYCSSKGGLALLVLGSSLTVMSGLRFVRHAAAAGKPVLIVNKGETRGDVHATVRVDLPLGQALASVLARL